jgi:hypothetical protein
MYTTRYGPHTEEAIHSDDMHCFNTNSSLIEKDELVVWWMRRRFEKNLTRTKYCIHSYVNKGVELVIWNQGTAPRR